MKAMSKTPEDSALDDRIPSGLQLAWGLRDAGTRGPKRGLTLDQIVAAGIKVAHTDGVGSMSMARIATELGVGTMSLYRYVSAEDELLLLMVDAQRRLAGQRLGRAGRHAPFRGGEALHGAAGQRLRAQCGHAERRLPGRGRQRGGDARLRGDADPADDGREVSGAAPGDRLGRARRGRRHRDRAGVRARA